MPRNPLRGFARRKSSGNILEPQSDQPAQPSFRVLERERPNGFVRRTSGPRPFSAMPFVSTRGISTEDLGVNPNRSSGTTTLSGLSGHYDTSSSSARYSSTSTLPSSLDQDHEVAQDELFPPIMARPQLSYDDQSPQAAAGASNHSFASRAGRAMSFGLKKKNDSPTPTQTPPPTEPVPALPSHAAIRDRATTISSYASTAVPPRVESKLDSADLGSDFGNMFEGLGVSKNEEQILPPPRALRGYLRSDSEPISPPRAIPRQIATPSPELEPESQERRRPQDLTASQRYSWQSRTSHDGLISPSLQSDVASPRISEFSEDTVKGPSGFSKFGPGYQPVPSRHASPPVLNQEESRLDTSALYGTSPVRQPRDSAVDKASHLAEPTWSSMANPNTIQSTPQWSIPSITRHPAVDFVKNHQSADGSADSTAYNRESQNTTPKAERLSVNEPLFDVSPSGPASRTLHPLGQSHLNASQSSPQKRMTRAQFEMERRGMEDDKSLTSDNSDDGYDDGDDEERQTELARQRRKQEANMAVYRQQMKKVSGGQPTDLPSHVPRPELERASMSAPVQSTYNAPLGSEPAGEEEDDDVPLGILQAHGFPNKNRPPTRVGNAPGSTSGSMAGDPAGGVLPPFARRLPVDPYFGAGLVNPPNRESLAFGNNSPGSVYGGAAPAVQPVHPAGLVGVIAGEERARAARRGSPNPMTGGYGPIPLPNNMQMPPMMPRSNSMMSMVQPPMMGYPQMQPMMSPMQMDSQQQIVQMMQMQQQMMQQIMQMQAGQMQVNQQGLGIGRPLSVGSNRSGMPNTGRSMSMMNPPPQWNDQANQGRSQTMGSSIRPPGYAGSVYDYNLSAPLPAPGYTPSIAPSERSNVGMPSRYRPVSTVEANGGNSRLQSMTGNSEAHGAHNTLLVPGTTYQQPKPTIRIIDKPKGTPKSSLLRSSADDEDDEEGWAQLRQKREIRKSRMAMQQKEAEEAALNELYTSAA